jgi:AcrR family transcriptional regulator
MNQQARPYVSPVREEQARRTRRAIVAAACELFLAQGYAATTVDAIAEAAHVSRRTVFNAVGSKATALKLALDWAIGGDDEPIAMADRPAVKAIQAERDPRKALTAWAAMVTEVTARVSPISEVLFAAADGDQEAAQLLAEEAASRMFGATGFVSHLASLDGLAPGVTQQQAAELCWALMDGHLYHLLVIQRGWAPAAFTQWLTDSLATVLLPPA